MMMHRGWRRGRMMDNRCRCMMDNRSWSRCVMDNSWSTVNYRCRFRCMVN